MKNHIKKIASWSAIAAISLGLVEMNRAAIAFGNNNQFSACISQIVRTGVSPQDAATACSEALIPKELSRCVAMIKSKTPINGNLALQACFQVRRPIDLGNCVVDIHRAAPLFAANSPKQTETETAKEPDKLGISTQILDSCRQSLLPGRFSECVIAVSRDVDKNNPSQALQTCLSAEDFPRDLFPSYPQNQDQRP
ncbi:MAG: hypothetical protein EWV49_06135 [Microcystis aeruginosa Ma_QC_Ch_20071001_S25]|jgi:hypothetical protein|uniref:Uncharacterized protein n=1 Tax=Microcystis aeruginosa Ma_QC_Ch_20071001_S25D TaxID=2486250 RepID=A0A552FJH4_MICAE|nr:hypothetical protein [Microcystis aeruginosa S11-05]NCR47975.1 hypothetical protein [Microcystis aeruginosa S11-01]TRU46837.1 MAG: hypothetical protein EWV57_17710 [Microcystis aeruginosa Ma_QC_Ch_20071001_S25D]TRU52088.1 MAG: hypothetical protein EWV49_06135 [Microcystis aeruginosa Ma_QC_Ch_20071001_S25]TRU63454.1 MAG: hypothetical protein EWV90_08620 [Microcystis aeruginosa Ma_QC_Ch_20071001_M135]